MVDINYLEDERKKLWEEVINQEKMIDNLREIIETNIIFFSDKLKEIQIPLPQDIKDAKQASKEAAFF